MSKVRVIGAGLAGAEAAWQIARLGVEVELCEMKPKRYSPAHHHSGYAELVCSNSLRSADTSNAVVIGFRGTCVQVFTGSRSANTIPVPR